MMMTNLNKARKEAERASEMEQKICDAVDSLLECISEYIEHCTEDLTPREKASEMTWKKAAWHTCVRLDNTLTAAIEMVKSAEGLHDPTMLEQAKEDLKAFEEVLAN